MIDAINNPWAVLGAIVLGLVSITVTSIRYANGRRPFNNVKAEIATHTLNCQNVIRLEKAINTMSDRLDKRLEEIRKEIIELYRGRT